MADMINRTEPHSTQIRAIGGIRVGDAVLRPKEQSILACLVAAHREPISALRLIELCWGSADEQLLNTLKTHVSRLRQHAPTARVRFQQSG